MYKKALVAIDLSKEEANLVLSRSTALIPDGVRSVVHVVEPQYVQYSFDPTFTGSMIKALEDEAQRSALRRVEALCEPHGIATKNQRVAFGHTSTTLKRLIADEGYDLLVIGTHGRRGSRFLLGSTANSVLHGTEVDVHAIRITPVEHTKT
ncbi:MAG: universal stress protein [Proteobacteria bacterium]|nr:universal stress protein [Pseudomonadota bacterium]